MRTPTPIDPLSENAQAEYEYEQQHREMVEGDYHVLTTCNPYRPCSCGVPSNDTEAANPERHAKDCDYRN